MSPLANAGPGGLPSAEAGWRRVDELNRRAARNERFTLGRSHTRELFIARMVDGREVERLYA